MSEGRDRERACNYHLPIAASSVKLFSVIAVRGRRKEFFPPCSGGRCFQMKSIMYSACSCGHMPFCMVRTFHTSDRGQVSLYEERFLCLPIGPLQKLPQSSAVNRHFKSRFFVHLIIPRIRPASWSRHAHRESGSVCSVYVVYV